MKKSLFIIGGIVILSVIAVTAWVLRPPAEATAPIEAIPLATATSAETTTGTDPVEETGSYPAPTEVVSSYPAPDEAVVQESYPAPEETGNTDGEPSGAVIFTITQAESEARFTLNEELRGAPATVVGVTDQVAGEMAVDFSNPANSQLGVITINARTLATDNNNRNRMIHNEILDTGAYEFITFTPTTINGLSESIAVGDTVTFQITGDLTIRDITQQVIFDATVTVISTERLEGLASVTVTRGAFDLVIPSVPGVANVTDEVLLELEFVAVPN